MAVRVLKCKDLSSFVNATGLIPEFQTIKHPGKIISLQCVLSSRTPCSLYCQLTDVRNAFGTGAQCMGLICAHLTNTVDVSSRAMRVY